MVSEPVTDSPTRRIHAFATYGRQGASARVRMYEWLDRIKPDAPTYSYQGSANNSARTLARHPASVVSAELRLRRIRGSLHGHTAFISRQASPLSHGRIEEQLLGASARGVYDFDDALFLDRRRPFPKSIMWERAVRAADVVIAGNATLADAASDLNDHVVIIPSCVDARKYVVKADHSVDDHPVAVWIGSPSTERYLTDIAAPLLDMHRRRNLQLLVISAGNQSLGALDPMVRRIQWSRATFAGDLIRANFGIMPLHDDPWSRGKCSYKLLQYGAAGLPMIGSPVGANAEVLLRADGLAPTTGAEWSSALLEMVDVSPEERQRRGSKGRSAVEQHYDFEGWRDTWTRAAGLS